MKILLVAAVLAFLVGIVPAIAQDTIMPTGTVSNGGSSWTTSDNYAIQCSVGQPFVGVGVSDNVEADAGFWNVLWVTEPPAGMINVGWNWIGVPSHPQFPDVPVIFETDPLNRLYKWDWLLKNTFLYPYDFSTIENTIGYMLREDTGQTPRYSGFLNRTPVDDDTAPDYRSTTIYIPNAGISTVGHPHPWPVAISDVKVSYGGVVRTAQEDKDAGAGAWVNWNWVYWDSVGRTARICSFSGSDDTMLRPWNYYRIWFYTPAAPLDPDGPFLIIPEPEVSL